jgi:hypothetical protein
LAVFVRVSAGSTCHCDAGHIGRLLNRDHAAVFSRNSGSLRY